jgi:hypothetical protein
MAIRVADTPVVIARCRRFEDVGATPWDERGRPPGGGEEGSVMTSPGYLASRVDVGPGRRIILTIQN